MLSFLNDRMLPLLGSVSVSNSFTSGASVPPVTGSNFSMTTSVSLLSNAKMMLLCKIESKLLPFIP